jgi:hypothetical protein
MPRARDESGRRRGRRGRGRDRSGFREGVPSRDRTNGSGRGEPAHRPPGRDERPDGVLTLARAFQLMSQALSEFRSPVGQEALRLRMVAMHGREDPLLDAARFPRLLRQANDAEVADVRKVGDDDYEISIQRGGARPGLPAVGSVEQPSAPAPDEIAPAAAPSEGLSDLAGGQGRENGQRLGLRFRRGSRGPSRVAEIPLIGVVQVESPSEPVPTPSAEEVGAKAEEPPRRARARRSPRKPRASQEPAAEPTPDSNSEPAAPKRPRARSRKKAE